MWFTQQTGIRPSHRKTSRRRLSHETLEVRRLLSVTPNDPRFHQQWGLDVTRTSEAWEISTGSTRVTVAVIDGGIDYTHPDLHRNIWLNQDEIPAAIGAALTDIDDDGLITFWDLNEPINQGHGTITDLNGNGYIDGGDLLRTTAEGGWADGLDNCGNGFIDDLVGWDYFDNDNDPMDIDPNGHGTAVAGIIGAVGNNGIGVTGINWRVQLMALRNLESAPIDPAVPGLVDKVVRATTDGIEYSLDNGADVINVSGSAPERFVAPDLVAATNAMLEEAARRDVLVVAAAGNEGLDSDVEPYLQSAVPHENVILVAATFRQQDRLADFGSYWASNFGATTVDLAAPGDYLWTTSPTSKPGIPYTATFGGTSGATPFVTGAAALVLSVNPDLSFAEIRELILDNVDPVSDLVGKTVTGGRLNIHGAVSAASDTAIPARALAVAAQLRSSSFAGNYGGWLDGEPVVFSISQTGRVEGTWQSSFDAPNDLNSLRGTVSETGELDVSLSIVTRKLTGKYSKTGFPYSVITTIRLNASGFLTAEPDGSLVGWLSVAGDPGETPRVLSLELLPMPS